MKLTQTSAGAAPLAAVGLLAGLMLLPGCGKPAPPPAPPKPAAATGPVKATNAPAATETNLSSEFVSVFDDSLPRVKTRDPFYPDSTREAAVATPGVTVVAPAKAPDLKLVGIAGSGSKRLAVINNSILAVGETSEVKTADGRVKVKVTEIGEDYVILAVEGESGPTRLTMGKKKQ